MVLSQNSIYRAACSICFDHLSNHEQKATPKNDGMKIVDNQGIII